MTLTEVQNRLNEIASMSLQTLEDDAVLSLLKERKELLEMEESIQKALEEEKREAEKQQQEAMHREAEEKAKESEQKRQALEARLSEVNKSITPDQDDEKLLSLIQERKELEAQLKVFEVAETGVQKLEKSEVKPSLIVEEQKEESQILHEEEEKEVLEAPETQAMSSGEKITITNIPYEKTSHVSARGKVSGLEAINGGRIAVDNSLQLGEYQGYLDELKANLNSLGTFLQSLPVDVKRNRAFMLEVANIDPAYAMHYADKDTLKKDESFNVAIAGMNNQRNTGNPLSEMLPEMRTGAVLLAGVKNDFRNVRFIRPEMPEYNEILAIAQKGALEAVKSLQSAHDIQFLLPPILQKDKAFMAEVEKLLK